MNFKKIRNIALSISFALTTIPSYGQDLLANQAPIDRKLKAVDSVTLLRLIEMEKEEVFNASEEIYKTWNTQSTHCYNPALLPDSFKIDLRGFAMPTPSRKITSKFGYRPRFRRMHKGLDVKVYTGDTIYAAFDGKARIVRYERKGYGYYIVLRHNNGLETIYGHLSKQLVKVNQEVKAGEPIGLGGNTGRSFGSHLHFETRLLGEPINPELLFDFVNQDVTNDFYVYHKSNRASSSSNRYYASSTTSKTSTSKSGSHYYKVRKGDNLYAIAKRLGLTVSRLCTTNRIKQTTTLRPGQILRY